MKTVESYIEEYKGLELNEVVGYNKFNGYAITAHSTQIEGSTLSIEETSLLIDEGTTPKGKPLAHSLMVKDHHNALQMVLKFGKNSTPLNLKTICLINEAVMKNTGKKYNTALGTVDSSKGELRKGSILVQKRYFPAYNKVPDLLNKLCEQLSEKMSDKLSLREQINLSYSAHFNLVSIHPHYDGNGRTARLLMNMIQNSFDLLLSIVYNEDKLEYFNALEESRDSESLIPFYEFMDQQYIKYLSLEIDRFNNHMNKGRGMTLLF
ncbi:Fic family protein [Reichenbachiella sp. MALMAid0571]|uniref:Fic family protein n=1 Tax=Reichenbachiella sp. MALMAid0571 TaxID=3143939 RepID=UPI0032E03B56